MASDVSNAEILQMLKGMDQRFDMQQKQIDILIDLNKEARQDIKSLDHRLRKVEDSIDGIKITWNNRLLGGTLAVSAATAAVVALLVVVGLG